MPPIRSSKAAHSNLGVITNTRNDCAHVTGSRYFAIDNSEPPTVNGQGADSSKISSSTPPIYYPKTPLERNAYKTKLGKHLTSHQWDVYDFVLTIPKGKVATYKDVALAVGGSPRSVGNALRGNPFSPWVPCHRIIASNLFVGGFFGEWGKDHKTGQRYNEKLEMLATEGVLFNEKGRLLHKELNKYARRNVWSPPYLVEIFPRKKVEWVRLLNFQEHFVLNLHLPANAFFSYTSGHWLCNDTAHKKARYAPFNVNGLQRVASKAVGSRVRSMTKIAESLNRVFLLTFEDGQEIIARIPTPICGPPHFCTASEVATMDFLGRVGISVPKVFAWSSRATSTEVEAEFILMEKVAGKTALQTWDNIDEIDFVRKLANFHLPLRRLLFTHYGSIYYKNDIDSSHQTVDNFLEKVPSGVDVSPFCMGPIARRDFWEDERAAMDINRGPWSCAIEFMFHAATREQIWINQYAKPHIHDDFLCGATPFQGKQDDHIRHLEYYKLLLPYLVPEEPHCLQGKLWHPDLHSANIFVTPSGSKDANGKDKMDITSVIDWQGAWVGPAFLQLSVPTMLRTADVPPEAIALPPDFDTLDADAQEEAQRARRKALLNGLFEIIVLQDIKGLPALAERRELDGLAQVTWKTGLVPFREELVKIWKQWNDIWLEKCPINFTPAEVDAQKNTYAYWLNKQSLAISLQEEFSLGEFGYVPGDRAEFNRVRMLLEKRRKECAATINAPDEIKYFLWPYRDTLDDNPRTFFMLDTDTMPSDPTLFQNCHAR